MLEYRLKDLKYFFLTTRKNEERVKNIKKILNGYDLTEFNPGLDCEKNKSGACDMCRMVDLGLRHQVPGEPFKPFVILEDDVSLYRDLPESISIPNDCDIFYIGIADSVMAPHTNVSGAWDIFATDFNDDIVRIYNMLDTHALIITSPAGAGAFQRCMMEAFYTGLPWDIFTARVQPFYKVYALKVPLMYQDGRLGGLEGQTKIVLKKYKAPSPPYTEHVCIKTSCNSYDHGKNICDKRW